MSVARHVGSVHLVLAGLINAVTGIVVVYLSLSGGVFDVVLSGAMRYATPATVLEYGDVIGFLVAAAPVFGLALVLLASVQIADGYNAYSSRPRRRTLVAAVTGSVNLLALPVGLIAVVLLGLSRAE